MTHSSIPLIINLSSDVVTWKELSRFEIINIMKIFLQNRNNRVNFKYTLNAFDDFKNKLKVYEVMFLVFKNIICWKYSINYIYIEIIHKC